MVEKRFGSAVRSAENTWLSSSMASTCSSAVLPGNPATAKSLRTPETTFAAVSSPRVGVQIWLAGVEKACFRKGRGRPRPP